MQFHDENGARLLLFRRPVGGAVEAPVDHPVGADRNDKEIRRYHELEERRIYEALAFLGSNDASGPRDRKSDAGDDEKSHGAQCKKSLEPRHGGWDRENKKSNGAIYKKSQERRKRRPSARLLKPSSTSSGATPTVMGHLPTWRNCSYQAKIRLLQKALTHGATKGEATSFTLNLDHEWVKRGRRSKKTFSTWVNERMTVALKPIEERLGTKIQYWFAIEISRNNVHHLHGAMRVTEAVLPDVRRALKRVAGARNCGASRYFVDLQPFDEQKTFRGYKGSLGWATYAAKNIGQTESTADVGSPLVCSRELNRHARELWERMRDHRRRAILRQAHRAPLSIEIAGADLIAPTGGSEER